MKTESVPKKKKKTEPREERKKKKQKSKVKSCGCGSFHVCLITKNVIELWVIETENSSNVFSVSITQKSENWVMEIESRIMSDEVQTSALLWAPPILDHELWKQYDITQNSLNPNKALNDAASFSKYLWTTT